MNNYYLISTEKFKEELRKIHTYYSFNYSIYSSNKFQKLLIQKIEVLKMFPKMYPMFYSKERLRKIPIEKYIIIYQVKNHYIYLVDIISKKSKKYNELH